MTNFDIAIKKDNENEWFVCKDRFPIEKFDVREYFLFSLEAKDIPHAVRLAKLYRTREIMRGGDENDD